MTASMLERGPRGPLGITDLVDGDGDRVRELVRAPAMSFSRRISAASCRSGWSLT
jgi:hypothetical protein